MIKSMTGFAKVEREEKGLNCQIEMRTVNSRHLDARVFLPKSYTNHEEDLKKYIRSQLQRGKLDCQVTVTSEVAQEDHLAVDPTTLENFISLQKTLEEKLGKTIEIDLSALMSVKGLIVYEHPEIDEEQVLSLIRSTLTQATTELIQMRGREGELLAKEIKGRLATMQALIDQVTPLRDEVTENYKDRILNRMKDLDVKLDENDPRLLQEIGLLIDKSDVSEEIERFNTHLIHFNELLESKEAVGRKMDFMLQEFNREANTLCSKAGNSSITEIGVNLKVEIEKVREQIQNIE